MLQSDGLAKEKGIISLSSDTAIPVVTLGRTDYKDYEDYQKKIKYYRTRSWIDFGVGTGLYVLTAAASVGINSKNTLTFVPIFGPIIRGCQSGTRMSKERLLMIAGEFFSWQHFLI